MAAENPRLFWSQTILDESSGIVSSQIETDITLRDLFAAAVQADDRLVKSVRAMDDTDLAIFARCPDAEDDFMALGEVEKYVLRFELEAKAIARVRFMQADAMLAERENAS